MPSRSRIFALLLIPALSACSTIDVRSQSDPTVDFSIYRNFDWLHDSPVEVDDPRVDEEVLDGWIRGDLQQGLAIRGLEQVDENPDLLVAFRATLDGGTEVFRIANATGSVDSYVRNYEQGAIIVDVLDADGLRLIFSASAEGKVHLDTSTREEQRARVREAIRKIVDALPRDADATVRAHWVHDDGTVVPKAELDAAAKACEVNTDVVNHAGASNNARYGYHAWSGGMLRCLAEAGIHLGNPPD